MRYKSHIFVLWIISLLLSSQLLAEPPGYPLRDFVKDRFENIGGESRDKNSFSIKLWSGFFDVSKSTVITNDSLTYLKGKQKGFTDNFWAGGINITDIPVFPSARKGIGKWVSAGINIFTLNGDYKVQAVSSDGLSSQKSELISKTFAFAGHIKLSPFIESRFQPYIGLGGGPAYTNLKDTRTTVVNEGIPVLEHDRKWDTSNLGALFGGIDIYLGKSFYFNLESQWLGLSNNHLIFANHDTDNHTAEVKTKLEGWLSSFGIGLKF